MNQKLLRILTIIFMVAVAGYTLFNYYTERTDFVTAVVLILFLGWMIFGQISALIREREE